MATGNSVKVTHGKAVRLEGLERIRFDSGHIVGTQRDEDGTRHVVSIRIAGDDAPPTVTWPTPGICDSRCAMIVDATSYISPSR